jgi:hypothetical protein
LSLDAETALARLADIEVHDTMYYIVCQIYFIHDLCEVLAGKPPRYCAGRARW